MSQLSQHFNREEFACKCGCGFDTVDTELLEVLEAIRQHFGEGVGINSGCRCASYNLDVGGWPSSQHKRGRAADIVVTATTPEEVQSYIDTTWPDELGLGRYESFTHVDTRNNKARW